MRNKDSFTLKNLFECENFYSLITTIVLLGFAFVAEHFANVYELVYSARPTSIYVGDILLDNLPVINMNIIIIEGALFSIAIGILFLLFNPRYILFTLKALALFIAIRALFVSLTHVGIYPGTINPGVGIFGDIYMYLNLQTGFFFSGHTGMPFLIALIFWKKQRVRNLFLFLSVIFAISVLFTHNHYSIDVLAAPFIAYGIYEISKYFFRRDYELIEQK